eukprot:2362552-Alexandrium_andersonii.AAC.1
MPHRFIALTCARLSPMKPVLKAGVLAWPISLALACLGCAHACLCNRVHAPLLGCRYPCFPRCSYGCRHRWVA